MNLLIVKAFIPEIFLSSCIIVQLVYNITLIKNLDYNFPIVDKECFGQCLLILTAVLLLFFNSKIEGSFSNYLLISNLSLNLIKETIAVFSILCLGLIIKSMRIQHLNLFEFLTLFLLSTVSIFLLISSNDFVTCYLCIEFQVLCYYILSTFKKTSSFSTEAGLKYFIFGSFFSCVFLFGCFTIYACLGTLKFNDIKLLLAFGFANQFLYLNYIIIFGNLLIFFTLLFKVASVPFHFWSPDVYEGSPLAAAVIFAVVSKIAIFHIFVKIVIHLGQVFYNFQYFLLITGVFSVFIGTFFALRQKKLKRLAIFSSITQTGFLVISLSSGTLNSIMSVYFFLCVYTLTSLVMWCYIVNFSEKKFKTDFFYQKTSTPVFLSDLICYLQSNKFLGILFACIFFSLAGIPPFCGFLAELIVFHNLIQSGFIFVTLILLLLSSFSAYYYIRATKIILFDKRRSSINIVFCQISVIDIFEEFQICIPTIGVSLLIFFFFCPEFLVLNCYYVTLCL